MADFSSIDFRPKDWQAFERGCRTLFECIWGDPDAQLNGRGGQGQNGVDIYGHDRNHNNEFVGVQCKGRNAGFNAALTAIELREEIEKAKAFRPRLHKFIIATTAANDAVIQKVAREISKRHEKLGIFSVHVYGWEEISARIASHDKAIRAFHPDATPFTDQILEGQKGTNDLIRQLRDDSRAEFEKFSSLLNRSRSTGVDNASSATFDTSSAIAEAKDRILHEQIDEYRDLLRCGQPKTALKLLARMKDRVGENASPRVRFRIVTNMGAAQYQLQNTEEAASLFFEAFDIDPTDKIGMSNRALAYLLVGRRAEARDAACHALGHFPEEPSVIVSAINTRDSIDELEALISSLKPDTLEVPMVSIAISEYFRVADDNASARRWAARSFDADIERRPEVRLLYAVSELSELFPSVDIAAGGPITEVQRTKLSSAISILQDLWQQVKEYENTHFSTAVAVNLANAYRFVDDLPSAKSVVAEALSLNPKDRALREVRAWLKFYENDLDGALEDVAATEWKSDTALMRAFVLQKLGRSKEAIAAVAEIVERAPEPLFRKAGQMLKADILLDCGKVEEAEAVIEAVLADEPNDIAALVAKAKLKKRRDKPEAAVLDLERAIDRVGPNTRLVDRYLLAQALCLLGQPLRSLPLLEGNIDLQRDNEPLRLYLAAAFDADQRATIKSVLSQLPVSLRNAPYYLRAAIEYHRRTGELHEALLGAEEYLQRIPGDWDCRLQWLAMCHRAGQASKIELFIDSNPSLEAANAEQQVRFAAFAFHYARYERALAIAYDNLRHHLNDPEAHMGFISLMLEQRAGAPSFAKPERIGLDTAFTVKAESGLEVTYIISDVSDPIPTLGELRPDHPLARRAIGLGIGEQLEVFEGRIPPDIRHITALQHKYVQILQRGMQDFENTFPDHDGLQKVEVEDSEVGLAPVLEHVKRRAEWIGNLISQYEKHGLPIGTIAAITGGTQISTYLGIVEGAAAVRVCIGTAAERESAVALAKAHARAGCLLDALTLYIVRRLEIYDVIERTLGKIHITQSTKEVFSLHLHQANERLGHNYMNVFYKDGQYYREEKSDEDIKRAINCYQSDVEWIERHCQFLAAAGQLSDRAGRDMLERLDNASSDVILAAKNSELMFLSEDMGLRSLVDGLAGIRGIWLQAALLVASQEGVIRQYDYAKAISSLVANRHVFTTLRGADLVEVADRDEWSVGSNIRSLLRALGDKSAEPRTSSLVVANFLAALWCQNIALYKRRDLTFASLSEFTKDGCRDAMERIQLLARSVVMQLPQLQQTRAQFIEAVNEWLRGHFLPTI